MIIPQYIGQTLSELAAVTNMFWYPIRVFVLADKNDDTGRFLTEAYSVQQIINKFPATADAVVALAQNYFGETILRIRAPKTESGC